jgi:hypothetical protein
MTKIVLRVAIVLGAASAALAGPKEGFWPKDTTRGTSIHHQASARYTPRSAYAFAPAATGASHIARSPETVAQLAFAPSPEPSVNEPLAMERQPTFFQVQPTVASVRQALSLKGAPTPAELGLKNAIERSASELRDKLIICRKC